MRHLLVLERDAVGFSGGSVFIVFRSWLTGVILISENGFSFWVVDVDMTMFVCSGQVKLNYRGCLSEYS